MGKAMLIGRFQQCPVNLQPSIDDHPRETLDIRTHPFALFATFAVQSEACNFNRPLGHSIPPNSMDDDRFSSIRPWPSSAPLCRNQDRFPVELEPKPV
jgi:hypothetical protein